MEEENKKPRTYRSNIIDRILSRVTPEEREQISRNVEENLAILREQHEQGYIYGTNTSPSLKILKEHGYEPTAICIIMCEETFVFKTQEEADRGYKEMEQEKSLVDGWWYGEVAFEEEVKNLGSTPTIYRL